jgi:hypothetical protein
VLDDAWHPLQRVGKHLRLGNSAEGAIENEIALIGEEGLAALGQALRDRSLASGLGGHGLDHAPCRCETEAHDFDGKRKGAKRSYQFAVVGDYHHLVGRGGHDLLP